MKCDHEWERTGECNYSSPLQYHMKCDLCDVKGLEIEGAVTERVLRTLSPEEQVLIDAIQKVY